MTRRQEIASLYAQKLTMKEIAERVGVSKQRIQQILKSLGIPKNPRIGRGRKFDHAEAARLYASGLSLEQVARRLGVTPPSVIRALSNSGVTTRKRGPGWVYDRPTEQMRAWYERDGMTLHEIGARMGRNYAWVRKVLQAGGTPMRPRGHRPAALRPG